MSYSLETLKDSQRDPVVREGIGGLQERRGNGAASQKREFP
jgi:hypothetical protein